MVGVRLSDGRWDGFSDLREVVAALHANPSEAVIVRSAFAPARIVRQTGGRAIVAVIREGSLHGQDYRRRTFVPAPVARQLWGSEIPEHGPGVYVDDNYCAHHAFNSCFGTTWKSGTETQLCHIHDGELSKDPRFFTALPNLVLVPSWLAKLTDVDDKVRKSLRWGVRIALGFCAVCGGDTCEQCAEPGHPLDEGAVRRSILRLDDLATDDYDAALATKNSNWQAALSASKPCAFTYVGQKKPASKPSATT